jgi:hypothetical protein
MRKAGEMMRFLSHQYVAFEGDSAEVQEPGPTIQQLT